MSQKHKEYNEKRRAKYSDPSPAQVILQGKQLMTGRPDGLPYAIYRNQRAFETRLVGILFPGPVNESLRRVMMPPNKLPRPNAVRPVTPKKDEAA